MFSGGAGMTTERKNLFDEINRQRADLYEKLNKGNEEQKPYLTKEGEFNDALAKISTKMADGQNEAGNFEKNTQDAANAHQIASEEFGDAGTEEGYARSKANEEQSVARSREQELKQKQEAETAYERQLADLRRNIETQQVQLNGLWDSTKFYEDMFKRDLKSQYEMACIQQISEKRQFGVDALLAFNASRMKFANAIRGDSQATSASALFNPHEYFNLPGAPVSPNQWLSTKNQAETQQANVDDLKKQLAEKNADSFPKNEVKEAKAELAEAVAKRESADKKYEIEKGEKKSAESARDAAKDAVTKAQDAQRAKEAELRELQKQAKNLENEMAKNRAKREEINGEMQNLSNELQKLELKEKNLINEINAEAAKKAQKT